MDPHEGPFGCRVLFDPCEVAGFVGQDSPNRPGQNGCGDGATTAGGDGSCAKEFRKPVRREERDRSDPSAASEGAGASRGEGLG